MAEKKNIEKLVKEGFEGTSFKAPDGLWSSINSALVNSKDTAEQKIKDSFDNIEVAAPLGIWEGIEKELTIDRGWRRTAVYLRRRTGAKWAKRVIAFAIFIFLITPECVDLGGISDDTASKTNKPRHAELVSKKRKEHPISDQSLRPQFQTSSNISMYSAGGEMFGKSTSIIVGKETGLGESGIPAKRSLDAVNSDKNLNYEYDGAVLTVRNEISVNPSDYLLSDCSNARQLPIIPLSKISLTAPEESAIIELKPTKNKLFEAGLFVGVTTTEIINNTTRAALDPSSLISLNPSISSHLGVQGVYHFSKSHSLVGSLNRLKVGQSTNQYSNGEYQKKDINFEFIRFQTMYQLKFKRFEEQRNFYTLKVGPYIGLLSRKSATVSGLSSNSSSSTETLEYIGQVDAGLSFHVGRTTALKNFVLDYGLSFDKGWVNLNKGTGNTPSSFDRTTTIDLGAYISVRYKF